MSPKKTSKRSTSPQRKTLTITKETYDMLSEWKGGERRGISFEAAIALLVEFAKSKGYDGALAKPGKWTISRRFFINSDQKPEMSYIRGNAYWKFHNLSCNKPAWVYIYLSNCTLVGRAGPDLFMVQIAGEPESDKPVFGIDRHLIYHLFVRRITDIKMLL